MFAPDHLIAGSDGWFYGTVGDWLSAHGLVVKLTQDGSNYTVLHSFPVNGAERNFAFGAGRVGDGTLYGTTWSGGLSECGTVFKLNRDGTDFTVAPAFYRLR